MTAFYNEIDEYAAQWLRNLIAAGHIAPGVVDTRSIEDVEPHELARYTQCHFFAGIGVWSYALRLAGWPDDRPVWTGSCPCQPFSSAGQGAGMGDERHLWPAWFHLIGERRPPVILGEQVASKDAMPWLDLVQTDLEIVGYAVGAVPFPSAGIGAPHIRDRLYFVAHASGTGLEGRHEGTLGHERAAVERGGSAGGLGHSERINAGRNTGASLGAQEGSEPRAVSDDARPPSAACSLADADKRFGGQGGSFNRGRHPGSDAQSRPGFSSDGLLVSLADADEPQPREHRVAGSPQAPGLQCGFDINGRSAPSPTNGFWSDAAWIACRDNKWRPVEPGTSPLAHGAPARVGRLRAYGNAINAEAARVFIEAYLGTEGAVA